jgi:ABC-type phosphate/phosphonate transport system substrate-binding protein
MLDYPMTTRELMKSRLLVLSAMLLALLALSACNNAREEDHQQGPPKGMKGFGKIEADEPGPIHGIMVKLGKGPQSLMLSVGQELSVDPLPWEKLQSQQKEIKVLIAPLAKLDPPQGSKESWAKLTSKLSDSVGLLDKAVLAKDKEAAVAAHKAMSGICAECHREHRPPLKHFGPPERPSERETGSKHPEGDKGKQRDK